MSPRGLMTEAFLGGSRCRALRSGAGRRPDEMGGGAARPAADEPRCSAIQVIVAETELPLAPRSVGSGAAADGHANSLARRWGIRVVAHRQRGNLEPIGSMHGGVARAERCDR